jgi:hypothetical protein
MKVYLAGTCHHKNIESIRKTLTLHKIPWEEHPDLRAINDTFTLAMCFSDYYPPREFPTTCKVIYGPHFFIVPDNPSHPLYHDTFDSRFCFNILTPWNEVVHREFCGDRIRLPFLPLFFGVDTDSIVPVPSPSDRSKVLVYFKQRHTADLQFALQYLNKRKVDYTVVQYGSYKDHEYKQSLRSASFVLWIGRHESQGFAFQETLASNVPILLWDAQTMYDEHNDTRCEYASWKSKGIVAKATAATVWSDACGIRFTKAEELEDSFRRMQKDYATFEPRPFIEQTVGLRASWRNLCSLLEIPTSCT